MAEKKKGASATIQVTTIPPPWAKRKKPLGAPPVKGRLRTIGIPSAKIARGPIGGGALGRPTVGSIIESVTASGIWTYRVRFQKNGKRQQITVARDHDRARGRKAAIEELGRLRYLWETETYHDKMSAFHTWRNAASQFRTWCRGHLAASSAKRYSVVLANWLESGFAPVLLRDTSGTGIEHYKARLVRKGRAASGINYEILVLKRFWSWARQPPRKWVDHDPFEGIARLYEEKGPDTAPKILTSEECEWFRAKAPPYAVPVLEVAIRTGLRLGELQWLDPDDVDLDSHTLHVRAKPGHRVKGKMRRTVPLDAEAWAVLTTQIERNPTGPIFPPPRSADERWWKMGDTINNWMRKLGIKGKTLHTCRSTFISHCLDSGVPLTTVQEWAGHESIQSTRRYISKVAHHEKDLIDGVRFP